MTFDSCIEKQNLIAKAYSTHSASVCFLRKYIYRYSKRPLRCVFTCVCTFVQRGSKFCFVVLLVAANLLRILHFRPISPCFQLLSILCHCMHVTLLGCLARQTCLTALPGRLDRQPCPAALPGSVARQPCPAALPASLARQPCQVALPASLARQPCPPALPASLAEKFVFCFMAVGRHACSIAYFYSAGSLGQAFPAIKDIAILSLVYKLISTCERG
jgi:hypothetical protein